MSILSQLIAAIYAAPPPGPSGNQTFSYLGSVESFTVPTGVTALNVNMWGAGGGSGGDTSSGSRARGGAGGFLKFTTAVTPGETLTAQVGGGGLKGSLGQQNRRPGTGGGMTSLVRGDPFYNDVAVLLHMNGANGGTTFIDSSANPKTLTVNGTVQTSTDQSKFGGSSLRTGTSPDNSRLTVSATGLRLTNTAPWTVEFWVRFDNTTAGQYFLAAQYIPGQPNIWFYTPSNGKMTAYLFGSDFSPADVVQDTWYFVSISHNGLGGAKFYVNGVLIASNNIISGQTVDVGWDIGGLDPSLVGSVSSPRVWIDDFRVTLGVDRYPVAFTPPTAEFPDPLDQYFDNNSLLLHMNGTDGSTTFTDSSSVPKTITANGGAQISTAQSKFGGGSLFTGTSGNNFLRIPASNDFIFGTGNFTVEGWFLPSGAGDERTFYIHGINTIGGLTLFVGTGGARFRANGTTDLVAGSSITTWTHIAFVRSGNTRYIFINGALSNSDSLSFNVSDDVVTDIGASSQNASDSFKYYGYIDELRVTKGVARYTAAFNPPNREFANGNGIIGIVGAGGGAGGYGNSNTNSWGGSGGDTTANAGGAASVYATGGGAGTPTAGGAAGTPGVGLAGSYLQGGAGAGYNLGTQSIAGWPNGGTAFIYDERGGGGGGGYYGGGGGGGDGTWGAGGGGGSSYTGAGVSAITHTKSAQNTITAPGNTETGYVAGVAEGGQNFNDGGNGLIYISWSL